ncbi:flagellin lysine-N-methylase [Brevibacillus reuszeri]|uniref:flagellin lysine-N-methylase n=1 Tax=Brevibacillus reuszeri TaxID=54915 RepID=UPI001B2D6359|nr:flagellin lysine-N-methylase [Brevibacillus reuszeri]GIO07344.1 flagellin lysine-N-methylase [Brevibacillus reuszeri]
MSHSNPIILVPKYMDQFQCIGSSCEDTCCAGWSVTIDKATYKKYKKVKSPGIASKLDKEVTRNRSNPTERNYAKISMSGCNSCPMLSKDSLCEIQLMLGEEYLSTTCASYPRVTNIVNGNYEMSANLSCPEAARLALLNPDPMEFFEIKLNRNNKHSLFNQIHPEQYNPTQIQFYFWDLRIFSIELLQNRTYSLTDRILILGLFFQNVQDLVNNASSSDVPNLIENYRKLVRAGSLRESLLQIPIEATAQIRLLKELIDVRIHAGGANQRYLRSFEEFLLGIAYEETAEIETIATRYQFAYDNYYKTYMDKHSYILENYLVNYIFKNTFPFYGNNISILDNYVFLALHYSLIKMHLIGIAGFHKEKLEVDHILTLIQSLAKTIEHNNRYLQFAFDYLKTREFTSIAGMAIFLKN